MEGAVESPHGSGILPVVAVPFSQKEVGVSILFPGAVDHASPIRGDDGSADVLFRAQSASGRLCLLPEDISGGDIAGNLIKGNLIGIGIPAVGPEIEERPQEKSRNENRCQPEIETKALLTGDPENHPVRVRIVSGIPRQVSRLSSAC